MGRLGLSTVFVAPVALAACGRVGFDPVTINGGVDATGVLDPTFGTDGFVVVAAGASIDGYDITRRGDGYLVLGSHRVGPLGADDSFALTGLTADGELDPAFGTGGILDRGSTGQDYGGGLTSLGDERLIVGAGHAGTDDVELARVDLTGAPITTFGTGGYALYDFPPGQQDAANRAAVRPDGTIVVCATADTTNQDSHIALLAVDATGAPVPSFGVNGIVDENQTPSANDICWAVIALPDGSIVAAGDGGSQLLALRYHADGTRDTNFGTGGEWRGGTNGRIFAAALAPDGDLVLAGTDQNHGVVARLSPAGVPRATFGTDGIVTETLGGTANFFHAVAVQPDGKIVAAGAIGIGPLADDDATFVRYNADGTLDTTFGTGGAVHVDVSTTDTILGLMIDDDGIVGVGTVDLVPTTRLFVARVR